MSSSQYRRLLTNLPSMAAVVNAFQSPEVQLQVYRELIDALQEATSDDDSASVSRSSKPKLRAAPRPAVEADLVLGDSIHSIAAD